MLEVEVVEVERGPQKEEAERPGPEEETWAQWLADAAVIVFVLLQTFFCAAIFFGWPALLVVLRDEGQYSELCDGASSGSSSGSGSGGRSCSAQDVRLNLCFTVAFLCNGASNFLGVVVDLLGPKLSNLFSGVVIETGLILLTIADSKTCDTFIPGLAFTALGGATLYYANFSLTNVATKRRTMLVAGITGLWIAGGLNFSVIQVLHFKKGISRRTSFLFLDVIAGVIFLASVLFIAPIRRYQIGDHVRVRPVWVDFREWREQRKWRAKVPTSPSPSPSPLPPAPSAPQKVSLLKQLFSLKYLAAAFYALAGSFFISWGIGTVQLQLSRITPDATPYVQLFVILSSLGLVVIPIYSLIIDKWGIGVFVVIATSLTVIYQLLVLVPVMGVQVANFVLFGFCRVSCGSTIGYYVRTTFGTDNFGAITGSLWVLSACISQIQTPIVSAVLTKLDGNFLIPDLVFAALPLVGLLLPAHIFYSKRQARKLATIKERA